MQMSKIAALLWLFAASITIVSASNMRMMMGNSSPVYKGDSSYTYKGAKGSPSYKGGKGGSTYKRKGKGYSYYDYYYYYDYPYPPYGSNGGYLPEQPNWVFYGELTATFGVANAENAAANDLTGAVSYGTDPNNPLYLDEDKTIQGGSFAYTARFVGETTVPAIITGALTVYAEGTTDVYGTLFVQGVQKGDFSVDLAIVGGSGGYVGARGQIRSPPLSGLVPLEVFFF